MTDNHNQIDRLYEKLEVLLNRQDEFAREISKLQDEIGQLQPDKEEPVSEIIEDKSDVSLLKEELEKQETEVLATTEENKDKASPNVQTPKASPFKVKSDLEKFIGENLMNKIGIVITIIGVAIGAKYTIEHDLISPLTRIVLGYMVAVTLLGFGIKLKAKYEGYSAVLVSGAISIMYFITYFAYSLYDLIPQTLTFILMAVFTAFTVLSAISYNRQVIAHIGLVGAYAVPFLLSTEPGKAAVLFSYIAIINIGILFIAFKKMWKPLYLTSFVLSWVIYLFWYVADFDQAEHLSLSLLFVFVFFATFYATFIAYKLTGKHKFDAYEIIVLLVNSFIFFGIGYDILESHATGKHLLGLFTLFNAIVHAGVSVFVYRRKLADKNLFYLITGLVLVFVSIAIPVQLDGSWVTLLWLGEALLLFWIGRAKAVSIYEQLSYPLILVAFISICQDWALGYHQYSVDDPSGRLIPVFNILFLTSVLFVTAFSFMHLVNRNKNYTSVLHDKKELAQLVSFAIPAILIFSIYYAIRIEIDNYWYQLYTDSAISINEEGTTYSSKYWNHDLNRFKVVWLVNYTLLFVTVLSFVNIKKIRNERLGYINLALNTLAIAGFLLIGLYALSELRENYLEQYMAEYYKIGSFHIGIRYISMVFVALALYATSKYLHQDFMKRCLKKAFDYLLYISVLWILSSELIHWMDMADSTQSYKLGLSILWGVYSLCLIVIGLWKKKKHLRVGAISVFGVTLIKLFFYDISHLNTISKIIVFLSLGVLLLIISFLYNKYKTIVSDEDK
ncbi:DUF2339 domain-containing protein [Labilibacter sediminis]|nr:DUF2339 domain-containing protein [Labilibacter sediminis]